MKTWNTNNHFKRKDGDDDEANKEPSCSITMSPIWATLPRELVNQVLDHHVTNHLPVPQQFHPDWPNSSFYAWLVLRNAFSSSIKQRIEGYYRSHILHRFRLALYNTKYSVSCTCHNHPGETQGHDVIADYVREEMNARHPHMYEPEYVIPLTTENHVEPPSDEDEKSWRTNYMPISECDNPRHEGGGDKLAMFRHPGWRDRYPDDDAGTEAYERDQERQKELVAKIWSRYAEALEEAAAARAAVSATSTTCGGQTSTEEHGGENNGDAKKRHLPLGLRWVSVELPDAYQPNVPHWSDHAYVRPEGFELPGFELEVLEPPEGDERREKRREGAAPELCVRFRWREVVTVVLKRLERGMDDEERAMAEEKMKKIRNFRMPRGYELLDDIW